uniref:Uncharacterized protein n=1 Tax=Triticum urartu TaxID=4572 RepID=A0A8R7JZ57_TRIUA
MNSTIFEATAQPKGTRSGTVCTAMTTTTTSVSRTRAIRARFSAAPKNYPIPVLAELADPQQKQTLDWRAEFLSTRYRRPSTSLSRVMVFMHLPSCYGNAGFNHPRREEAKRQSKCERTRTMMRGQKMCGGE